MTTRGIEAEMAIQRVMAIYDDWNRPGSEARSVDTLHLIGGCLQNWRRRSDGPWDIASLVEKYHLHGRGLGLAWQGGRIVAWLGDASSQGYVQICPPGNGIEWADTAEEAIERLLAKEKR